MPKEDAVNEPEVEGAARWNARYAEGATGWDLAGPAPLLRRLVPEQAAVRDPEATRVLVVGAGYGHDALFWARHGFLVTAVDFAPLAVEGLRARAREAGLTVEALEANLFALPSELHARFDVVWEHTCFCAITPGERPAYVAAVAQSLVSGGVLHGVFWNNQRQDGPPYDTTPQQLRACLVPTFEIEALDPLDEERCARAGEFQVRARYAPASAGST